jgi:hypothetical protein
MSAFERFIVETQDVADRPYGVALAGVLASIAPLPNPLTVGA